VASRNYLKHTVSDTQPSGAALGDEWYQPDSNILYKCVATNGTSVTFVPVATTPNNNLSVTGSIQGTQVIASTGLLGISATPSPWATGWVPLQIGFGGGVVGRTDNSSVYIASNTYFDGSNYRYINNGFANYTRLFDGQFFSYSAASGTAGGITSFESNLELSQAGNLRIPKGQIEVSVTNNTSKGAVAAFLTDASNGGLVFKTELSGTLAEKVRIDSAGNVGIGTTAPSSLLHVFGSVFPIARIERTSVLTTGMLSTFASVHRTSGNMTDGFGADISFIIRDNAGADNEIANVGAVRNGADNSGAIAFRTHLTGTSSEKMRIDASGNVGIGTTSPTLPLNIGTSTLPAGVTIEGQMISSDVAALTPLLSLRRSAASGNPIFAQFTSSGTAASPTAVAINRSLGRNDWWGFDGTNYINAAAILCSSDGAVSTGVVPGRLVFATSTTNTPVEAMRITSAGNVGIGISTPGGKLNVVGDVLSDTYLNANGSFYFQARKARGTVTTPLIITSSDVIGGLLGQSYTGSGWLTGAKLEFRVDGTVTATSIPTSLTLFTGDGPTTTERMRIVSGGNVLIGTTTYPTTNSPGILNLVSPVGNDGINLKHLANGNNILNLWQTGTTGCAALAFYKGDTQTAVGNISLTTTATAYNSNSDYRLKENVLPMTGALIKVAALKPCTYTWKSNGLQGQGFIAHELKEVVPDAVTGKKDEVYSNGKPKYQGVDTSFLVATLVAAIQEQQALITQLQIDVAELKGKN
jgi:hypothetical protein